MKQQGFPRRRFLKIAAAVPLAGLSTRARAVAPVAHWHGVALGASSQIILSGLSDNEAAPLFAQVRDEIARLESIFSLYQRQSEVSQLNATGLMLRPAPELLEVLSLSRNVWEASFGAFDPSVQTRWRALAQGETPDLGKSNFGNIGFSSQEIVLEPGMALTFNGIAQGYITDHVVKLLQNQGLNNLIVNAGEQRALGDRPGGGAWRVGISDPSGYVLTNTSLSNRALATSSPRGTLIDGEKGHIIDGRNGHPTQRWGTVSVTHDSAAVADALSTAACCLSENETADMLRHYPTATLSFRV